MYKRLWIIGVLIWQCCSAQTPINGDINASFPAKKIQKKRFGRVEIARIQYSGSGEWYFGESALPNFCTFLKENTSIDIGEPPETVSLTDTGIGRFALLYLTGHGEIGFTDREITCLRRYLKQGGFLLVNDNGPLPDDSLDTSFRFELQRLYPGSELIEIQRDHPIYHVLYDFPNGVPRVREHDAHRPPQGFGVFDEGRMVLYYAHNSDFASGWEDEEVYHDPEQLRLAGFRMGTNILWYALTH